MYIALCMCIVCIIVMERPFLCTRERRACSLCTHRECWRRACRFTAANVCVSVYRGWISPHDKVAGGVGGSIKYKREESGLERYYFPLLLSRWEIAAAADAQHSQSTRYASLGHCSRRAHVECIRRDREMHRTEMMSAVQTHRGSILKSPLPNHFCAWRIIDECAAKAWTYTIFVVLLFVCNF
jgi:hypothetical protein